MDREDEQVDSRLLREDFAYLSTSAAVHLPV
jgi:hypothetical protein